MKQSEMRSKICPIISIIGNIHRCYGDECMGFGSRRTYEFLGDCLQPVRMWNEARKFHIEDDAGLIKGNVDLGWQKVPSAITETRLRREGEPDCWCDAMPGSLVCSANER